MKKQKPIKSGGKQLFSDSVIYALANILQRGMMLILLPIYARYFSKSEFGAMDLLYQSILILVLISSLGLPQGLPRGFYKENTTEVDNKKLLGVLSLFIFPITLTVFGLIWLLSPTITEVLFNQQGNEDWIKLTAILFVAMVLQQFPLAVLKARKKAAHYSLWSFITFILVASSNIYFIIYKQMGLPGMLISNIIGFGSVGIILTIQLSTHIIINIEWHRLKPLLAFGLPMLPALLFRKVIDVSDRYFLPQLHSMDALGEYVMAVKIANMIEIAVLTPFLFAWQPFFYSIAHQENAKEIFAKVTLYFFMILSLVFLIIVILAPEILQIIGNGEYASSVNMSVFLVLAALLNGVQYTISPGIHLSNKLTKEAACMFAAAVVNIIFNIILIPIYAGIGAAYATLIAFGFYLVITFCLANKFYPIKYQYGYILKTAILTAIFSILIYQEHNLMSKLELLSIYLIVGPVFDLYRLKTLSLFGQFKKTHNK